jgi:two-component system, NtrC family, sensor kinase
MVFKIHQNFPNFKHQGGTAKHKLDSKVNLVKFNSSWTGIGYLVTRFTIAQKIGYGYALAIGIAFFGTTIGLVAGEYYQQQAETQQKIANQQQDLIYSLESSVASMRSHPQRLVAVMGQSIWFDYETSKFFSDIDRVQTLITKFAAFVQEHPDRLAVSDQEYRQLLQDYQTHTKSYTKLIKELWIQIDPSDLTPAEIPTARNKLIDFLRDKPAIGVGVKFDRLEEKLEQIKTVSQQQHAQAKTRFARAEMLRKIIILSSMVLSSAIAVILAIVTSRAIARPLQAVTQVANAIVEQSNFNLRSPVTTNDEVGSLATSLNQLVEWVGEYTQALEFARQTLEQRVEERTQELTQTLKELKDTQTQLIQTEKMSSLGQMVAGIAHEINNPVNFIHGNLQYVDEYANNLVEIVQLYQEHCHETHDAIQDKIEDIDLDFISQDFPKMLASMHMGTERIRQIVLSLRNFSRLDESEMKPVDIHEGIDNTLLILNHRCKHIELVRKYGDLPLVECYPAQLNQVFMNIISNAIDALEADRESEGYSQIYIITEKTTSNYITVTIGDNGPGIPDAIKAKLFDPFFTTKPEGKGTGLGLSISYQIIERHKGKIQVRSQPGKGTEFAIALPILTVTAPPKESLL